MPGSKLVSSVVGACALTALMLCHCADTTEPVSTPAAPSDLRITEVTPGTVTIAWKDVTAMTKEKTALVIPNAVQICTGSDKYFFTSFAARDKTHVLMFRLWQNSLLDNPALAPELWSWVRSVYGDKTER